MPLPIAVLVKQEGLGDCCLRLPFLRAIARGFSDRDIWWISSGATGMGGSMAQYARGLITELKPKSGISGRPREVIPRLKALPPFSLVFDMRTGVSDVLLARRFLRHEAFICGLPFYAFSDRRPPGRIVRPPHMALRAMSLAEAALGEPLPMEIALDRNPTAVAAARALLPDGPVYVGLAVGSGEEYKNWPLDRFVDVAAQLDARGIKVVLLTGVPDPLDPDRIPRQFPHAIDQGKAIGSVDGLVAIADRLRLSVANDGGLGHVVATAGCPVISLFGRTDPARWAPLRGNGMIVRAQTFGGNTMSHIPVDAVMRAIDELLARRSRGGS